MSYSQRLLQQGTSLTRLAHQSRFKVVLDLLEETCYEKALDYGCGDGWLLKTAYEQQRIKTGIGVDVDDYMLNACAENLQGIADLQYCFPHNLAQFLEPQSCDLFVCTETLEHVNKIEQVFDLVLPYCKPQATFIISVPLEVGPSLLFKQIGRYFANLKGNYGYERYTPKELFSAAILWDVESFPSSHSLDAELKGHKGFNYQKVERILQNRLTITRKIFSPFPWFNHFINSTVIWVCKNRDE
ncbi:class I SAM-dependent methyltransferase [Spirulina subsalsa]|uniref:class I SAM-dependent methyltransferase n=1 Tax=Spirulina subsalsa TaxID=54311 RepID=UPI0003076123|nr:class I SAM-dependent methyltransferase [Spirulina subsalsa]